MSALQIILLNLHSQWGIYIVCRGLDTAVLFVTECLRRLRIYVWEHPMLVIFYFVKACQTDCQTCRIKDKSMHALLMTCIAKQEQDGGQLDVIYAGLLPHGEKKQVSYRSVPYSVGCIMVCCHGLQSNDCYWKTQPHSSFCSTQKMSRFTLGLEKQCLQSKETEITALRINSTFSCMKWSFTDVFLLSG